MRVTPERSRQVEVLYHGALEQPATRRLAWLAETCAGDVELQRDVESLLVRHASATGTLDGGAADLVGDRSAMLAPGRRLGV